MKRLFIGVCLSAALLFVFTSQVFVQSLGPLVPIVDATHSATQSGNWSDPNTWTAGALPTADAKVHIPAGVTVNYDQESTTALNWVRVDGSLVWTRNGNMRLTLDTLACMNGGRLEIGTEADPWPEAMTARLVIAARNNQPIDMINSVDFSGLGRGVIAEHGCVVELNGASKTTFVNVSTIPGNGATSMTVDEAPQGWNIGDALVFTSSTYGLDSQHTLTAINGTTVTFTPAISSLRVFPSGLVNPKLHLGNLTRNVKIETLQGNVGNIPLHGHFMLMHSGGHKVRFVEIANMGRTLTDSANDPIMINGVRDASLMPLCGLKVENPRGRYALHFHMNGPTSTQSVAYGNAIYVPRRSKLRVGIQNHSSNVSASENVVLNIGGSALFTEEGDEIGDFTHNLTVFSDGREQGGFDADIDESCPKEHPEYTVIFNRRRMYVGNQGYGLWLHGGGVDVINNVFSGAQSLGMSLWPRPLDFRINGTFHVQFNTALLRDGGAGTWAAGHDFIEIDNVPPKILGNVAYASDTSEPQAARGGFESKYWGQNQQKDFPTSPKGQFDDNTSWNNMYGAITAYAGWMHYKNFTHIQGAAINPRTNTGIGMQLAVQGGNNNIVEGATIQATQSCINAPTDTVYVQPVTCNGKPFP